MLPEALARKASRVWGEEGRRWAAGFPKRLRTYVDRWGLGDLKPSGELSYNYVAFAQLADGHSVVLKLGFPNKEFESEAKALKAFGGHAAVRLIDEDVENGALLLERLQPGVSLWSTWTEEHDDEQTEIAGKVMQRLWNSKQVADPHPLPLHPRMHPQPTPSCSPCFATGSDLLRKESGNDFKSTVDWCQAYDGFLSTYSDNPPFSKGLVEKAKSLSGQLHQESSQTKLLHGDLHHGNILSAGDGWKVIDPKGIIGDPAFEAGAWIRNPMDRILRVADLKELIDRRLRIISDITQIDFQRLHAWAFCVCVLSACWSAEDEGGNWDEALACAQALD